MKSCFSEYGKLWGDAVPMRNMNLWSLILIVCAMLIIPPLIQAGEGNALQFVGFLAPLYLFLVAFTPNYKESKKENLIHQIGAWTCVVGILVWMIFIMHMWVPLVVCGGAFIAIGLAAKNLKYALMYYLELATFMSTYWCLLSY